MSLESIDTSYWKTKDKSWKEERLAQWPAIERVVEGNRRKSDVNVIKQYFLRGKMPPWEKYRDWDDLFRHLDLNMFLWLHPCNDPEILKALYKSYMESELVHKNDVLLGYGLFLKHELLMGPSSMQDLDDYLFPYMGNKNIILFRIMFGDLDYAKERIKRLVGDEKQFNEKAQNIFEFMGFNHFLRMRTWLMQDRASPLNKNCLFQYDDALEWCLSTITQKKIDEFRDGLGTPEFVKAFQRALYCIHHFDTEKEGETQRTQFVQKIHKILDEREFIPEFKKIWEDVKAGKIDVEDPWKI